MSNAPTLRLIHHLPRSGGTVMCKCIGSLPGVILLSEINPRAVSAMTPLLEPVFQASFWFRLFDEATAAALLASNAGFAEKIRFIADHAARRGERLVIRDWTYIDFFARPYRAEPTYRLSLAEALADSFEMRQAFTVRHPLDQWLSWVNYAERPADVSLEAFMRHCRNFAELAGRADFIRYEDFVAHRDASMKKFCDLLALPFDPVYATRWRFYRTISGEVWGGRRGAQVRKLTRRACDEALLDRLYANEDYRTTLALLGYRHEEVPPAPGRAGPP